MPPTTLCTLEQRPDLEPQMDRLHAEAWPEFLRHDAVSGRYWQSLFGTFAAFQLVLMDQLTQAAVAAANAIPLAWDGTVEGLPAGWDAALERGTVGHGELRAPNTLCALAVVVARSHRGQGLSRPMVEAMRALAAERGYGSLIVPLRPTLKSLYPLTPMERYILWKQADGAPFDPWQRLHASLGAEVMGIAPHSMVITGTVAEWEEWTAMRFPESGAYVVPGALQPITIDRERDEGRYDDPNVWMRHVVS